MQAARGASLNPSDPAGTTPSTSPRRFWLFLIVWALGYAADVASKVVAVRELSDGRTVPVIGDILTLHLIRNPGAAFSTGEAFTEGLSAFAILATCAVVWFAWRTRHAAWATAIGLIGAGITGNLTDRLMREPGPLRGHVVDFLQLPHWPIFNVADICINVGAALILVLAFKNIPYDGGGPPATRTRDEQRS